jgi:hypothetical protein
VSGDARIVIDGRKVRFVPRASADFIGISEIDFLRFSTHGNAFEMLPLSEMRSEC